MADERAYRIQLQYVPEDETYLCRVPELDLRLEADTRAEALQKAEALIEETVEKAAVAEERLPRPIDIRNEGSKLELELAAPVARDLEYHARAQGISTQSLALQLLTRSLAQLEARNQRRVKPMVTAEESEKPQSSESTEQTSQADNRGKKDNRRTRHNRGRRREGYRPDMEDQANFLAYVREQERGGGRGRH